MREASDNRRGQSRPRRFFVISSRCFIAERLLSFVFEGLWSQLAEATSETGEGSNRRLLGLSARVDGLTIGDRGIWKRTAIAKALSWGLGEALLCFLQYQEVQRPKAPHRG